MGLHGSWRRHHCIGISLLMKSFSWSWCRLANEVLILVMVSSGSWSLHPCLAVFWFSKYAFSSRRLLRFTKSLSLFCDVFQNKILFGVSLFTSLHPYVGVSCLGLSWLYRSLSWSRAILVHEDFHHCLGGSSMMQSQSSLSLCLAVHWCLQPCLLIYFSLHSRHGVFWLTKSVSFSCDLLVQQIFILV